MGSGWGSTCIEGGLFDDGELGRVLNDTDGGGVGIFNT